MTGKIARKNPKALFNTADYGYSQISIAEPGRMAFIAGQAAIKADGSMPELDLGGQTDLALENVGAALEAINAGPADILLLRCYVTRLDTEAMAEVLPRVQKFLCGEAPGLVVLGTDMLAAPELRVAFELTARVPD